MDVCILVFLIPYEEEFTVANADGFPVRRDGKGAIESVRTILAKLMKRVFYESIRTQSTTISANISGCSAQDM